MAARKTLLDAIRSLGRLGSIAKADEGFDPGTPEAARVVRGTIKPKGPATDLDTFGFPVHSKGSVSGGEAIPAEGITLAVRKGALGGALLEFLGADWEADQTEDTNAARYCAGSRGSNLWNDDLMELAKLPMEEPAKPPVKPAPGKPPADPFRTGVEAVCVEMEGEAPASPPQGGRPSKWLREAAQKLRKLLSPSA